MLCDIIRKDMVAAMKSGNKTNKDILSLLLGQLRNRAIELHCTDLPDEEVLAVMRKMIKQLDEEIKIYTEAGRTETYSKLESQKKLLMTYLPAQLSEDEIIYIINNLKDKSIPAVMKYFKVNHSGRCDMSLVNRIIKAYNKED